MGHKTMDKKLINSKIIAVKNELINKNSKIENSLAYKFEIPEKNKKTNRKQNKIRDKITIEPPLDNNIVTHQFKWANVKETEKFYNTLKRDNKKDKTNTKIYIRKKKYITAFHAPNNTIYVHRNTKRILAIENPYHQDNNRIKFRN